ncbi:MAG: fasciclin domain-containing protein [Acidimicrobiales bacterium]|nr:fasciclin domain-containing protein [Acidimicrobiales bacterium]
MRTPKKSPRVKRSHRLIALLAACSLLFAACSDDDTDTTTDPAPVDNADGGDDMAGDDMGDMDADMLGAFGPACGAVPADGEGSFAGMADDTAATAASANPLLSTLVSAVVEADLVDTLNSDGPFTIFAPTNDAFAAIPADILDAVLADKDLLTSVLTYHVIGGQSSGAADLGAAGSAATVEGGDVTFGADGTVVNDANVVCSDVSVANGTVHIIDSVLLPQVALDAIATLTGGSEDAMLGANGVACSAVPTDGEGSFAGMADDTAATAASANPLLSTLVTAVVEADLVDTLNSDGPFTIFAPTNDAFAAIPEDDLNAVLADIDTLTSILTLHVIAGEQMSSADLVEAGSATTVNGADLMFAADGDAVTVNGVATTICQDVPTANATVHIIDAVLLP